MKSLNNLLLLGDPRLYQPCEKVLKEELPLVAGWVNDLHNVMQEIRLRFHFGRGIAAPQLGIMKRLFYINIDNPIVIINPELKYKSEKMIELWDDCMSFPHLLVNVRRHANIELTYRNEHWEKKKISADGGLSELIQHEYDHLDGILCIDRAIDKKSFKWRP